MGLLLACASSNHGPAVAGTSTQTMISSAQASDATIVERVANARCDREEMCSNIGPGRKYVSRNVCMEQIRGGIANDINGYNCPRGVDSDALDSCMAAIKNNDCSNFIETMRRSDRCRPAALCLK
jgi:hypothetical protein